MRAKYEKETLENKIKTLEMQNEIQALKHQIEIEKLKAHDKNNVVQKPSGEMPDRFFEGAEKFLVTYNTGEGDFFGESYKLWYEDMSRSMENRKQYVNDKFVVIRKEVKQYFRCLFFISKRVGAEHDESSHHLMVDGLHEKTTSKSKVFVLHPIDLRGCLEMKFYLDNRDVRYWEIKNVLKDYYLGDTYAVIILAELK